MTKKSAKKQSESNATKVLPFGVVLAAPIDMERGRAVSFFECVRDGLGTVYIGETVDEAIARAIADNYAPSDIFVCYIDAREVNVQTTYNLSESAETAADRTQNASSDGVDTESEQ